MDKLALHGGKPISESKINLVKPTFSDKSKRDIGKVLDSGYIRQGPYTEEFEKRFAERVGAGYAYAVSNGTAALHVAYLSLLRPGEEVLAPAFTFISTISTVFYSNCKPVLADIDPETFMMDVEDVKEKINDKTRALAPVHLFGNAADLDALSDLANDHDLYLVNDSCQAHGTEYDGMDIGSWDHLNCYSFYPTKTLTTGEGGIVTTNDEELDRVGRLLRSHGDDARYHHIMLGLNYRFTDIAAVIALEQLSKFDEWLMKRRDIGMKLREGVSRIDGISPQRVTEKVNHSYSYFSVTLNQDEFRCTRDEFMEALRAENIDCTVHYPIPLTKQPAVLDRMKPDPCPVSESLSKRILSLPMHPYLSDEEIEKIIAGVEKVAAHYHI